MPEASLARTRHHMVWTGSVLAVKWEAVTFWFTVSGAVKLLVLAMWMV